MKCLDGKDCAHDCEYVCDHIGQMSNPYDPALEYEFHYCSDHRGGAEYCHKEALRHVAHVAAERAKLLGAAGQSSSTKEKS